MSDMRSVHAADSVPTCSTNSTPIGAKSGESSIEFRALLDRLREQAASLEKASEKSIGAHELSGAVQEASASLHGALSIAENLLEAYRSSRVASSSVATGPSASGG